MRDLTKVALDALERGTTLTFNEPRAKPSDPTPLFWRTALAQGYFPGHPAGANRIVAKQVAFTMAAEPVTFTGIETLSPAVAAIPRRALSFRARARTTDPATSHTAAATVDITKDVYQRILTALKDRGGQGTDADIWDHYYDLAQIAEWPPLSPSGMRTRRAELVAAGKVVDSGKRGVTPAGRSCIVWRLA